MRPARARRIRLRPAAERLIRLLYEIFAAPGGEAGRGLPQLLREIGIEQPEIDAHVVALKPGHPYLRLPLQFSVALESRLLERVSDDERAAVIREPALFAHAQPLSRLLSCCSLPCHPARLIAHDGVLRIVAACPISL